MFPGAQGVAGNAHLKKAYEKFAEKHGGLDKGIPYDREGMKGTLWPDGAWCRHDPYFNFPGVKPPEDKVKRAKLIFAYYETKAKISKGKFLKLQAEIDQRIRWASEHAGEPNAATAPDRDSPIFKKLEQLRDIARMDGAALEEVRKYLFDERGILVTPPDPKIAREAAVRDDQRRASESFDRLREIQL